jgi:hypothetical protein
MRFGSVQERAYMMLQMNGGGGMGSDYGSWEAGSYECDDEVEDDYEEESNITSASTTTSTRCAMARARMPPPPREATTKRSSRRMRTETRRWIPRSSRTTRHMLVRYRMLRGVTSLPASWLSLASAIVSTNGLFFASPVRILVCCLLIFFAFFCRESSGCGA